MRQLQCVPTKYVFSISEIFTIRFFKQILNLIQINEHLEMSKFSCSLSCTWMTKKTVYSMLLTAYLKMFHGSILLNC